MDISKKNKTRLKKIYNSAESTQEAIRLRRLVILHSIIYYSHNTSIIPDSLFDDICKRLVDLQEKAGSSFDYFDEEFKDFDGSTGMHLTNPYMLKIFGEQAQYLIDSNKG